VFEPFLEAVLTANRKLENAGLGDEAYAHSTVNTTEGPAGLMSPAVSDVAVDLWLTHVAEALEKAALSGTVSSAPNRHLPTWISSGERSIELTGFVAYQTADQSEASEDEWDFGWRVRAEATRDISAQDVSWAAFAGADVYLRRGTYRIRTSTLDVSHPLAEALSDAHGGVTYVRKNPRRVVSADYERDGRAVYGVLDESASWQQNLNAIRTAILGNVQHIRLAFVRYTANLTRNWDNMAVSGPPLPGPEAWNWRYNSHLLDDYVPDAHGLQLLSDRHLAQAHDLSAWLVEPLGHGLHLVSSPNPTEWFQSGGPDPKALARARSDFGNMILSDQALAAHPPVH
jgi:hypothetical protein